MDEMTMPTKLTLVFIVYLCFLPAHGRIFDLDLKDDERKEIQLSTFGFLKKGTLAVNMTLFSITSPDDMVPNDAMFGFTLDKSGSKGISSYMEDNQGKCILSSPPDKSYTENSVSMVFFRMNFKTPNITIIRRGTDVAKLLITDDWDLISSRLHHQVKTKTTGGLADNKMIHKVKRKREATDPKDSPTAKLTSQSLDAPNPKSNVDNAVTPIPANQAPANQAETPAPKAAESVSPKQKSTEKNDTAVPKDLVTTIKMTKSGKSYSAFFGIAVDQDVEEGLYNMYFHNCYNYPEQRKEDVEIHLMLSVTEANDYNFLSAGEMPIPALFFALFVLYVLAAIIWSTVLKRGSDDVYKIHYLMLSVIIVKSLSCLFRSINSHFISVEGFHEEAWAVMYYIVYLTKGALLFSTILLIGAGWAFVKHILSIKEKKLFLIILPLQVLDNVAFIIVEESQEGQSEYTMWKEVFIIIDLLCCGAILFPVVWSIRHLQQSARTDGKAAISLQKLKLFRQFYIMVVCYIYFTRIIAYLIKITVPFQYEWLYDLFRESTSFLFFLVTGYKFRPASNNPYLQIPQESDDELEMEEVVTESAALDTVKRVNQKNEDTTSTTQPKQRESSHEYD